MSDRNFDDLAARFSHKVYSTLKGRLRLAVLRRDFTAHLPLDNPLRVLDAGGGQGHWALSLAMEGHEVALNDISLKMLDGARQRLEALDPSISERVRLLHGPIQSLSEAIGGESFDLVMSHAVMEWMHKPEDLLPALLPFVRPGGYFSLMFYNRDSLIFRNLLRGNWRVIERGQLSGAPGSLTPPNPMVPATVREWLYEYRMRELCCSGVRVIHDYIFDRSVRERDPDTLEALELKYSRQTPYRDLGRYLHILCQKTA